MPSGITQRIFWLTGKDANGGVRYCPATEWTEATFARDVLGNVYARVERTLGYGVMERSPSDIGGIAWTVFPTRSEARQYFDTAVLGGTDSNRAANR